jgi:hypothetical protein
MPTEKFKTIRRTVIETHKGDRNYTHRAKGKRVRGRIVKMSFLLFFTVTLVAWTQSPAYAQGLLRVSKINPRYFTTAGDPTGKAVYMVGSHNWQVLQDRSDQAPFNYPEYLQFLKTHNHNFFRMWYYDTPHAALFTQP